jgi:hypothetical protein
MQQPCLNWLQLGAHLYCLTLAAGDAEQDDAGEVQPQPADAGSAVYQFRPQVQVRLAACSSNETGYGFALAVYTSHVVCCGLLEATCMFWTAKTPVLPIVLLACH